MSPAITVENLSKRYTLSHREEGYLALRDVIAGKAQRIASRMLHPLRRPEAQCGDGKEPFWALRDISFKINQGDRVGIIGRNGAGKSTLLKVLSRITEPTSGRVRIRGRVVSLLEVGTGFHPELSGRENIFLNGAILGMTRHEIKSKFDEIVDFAEIERFIDTPVKRYSSGMYVRLAFAVAAHLEPEILVVDEVLAVGDAQFQKKCIGKMGDVSARQGRTVLFVSHNMTAISNICNRGLLLDQGRLAFEGAASEAIERYLSINGRKGTDVSLLPRSGGDQAAITDAWIQTRGGSRVDDVLMGSSVEIRFKFAANRTLVAPRVGVGIENVYGQRVFTIGNEVQTATPFANACNGTAVFSIPNMPLMPGKYLVSLGLGEKADTSVDYVERAFSFTVVPHDLFGTGRNFEESHGVVFVAADIRVEDAVA